MKLYIEDLQGGFFIIKTDWVRIDSKRNRLTYFNERDKYSNELGTLKTVKLDGELLYGEKEKCND